LLDAGHNPLFWTTVAGAEFPGASADLGAIDDNQQGRCLRVRCHFTGESRYAGSEWRGTINAGKALGFQVRLSHQDHGIVRVLDSGGQWHAGNFEARRGVWSSVRLPLQAASFRSHWAGANDGQLHFPLRKVLIAVNRRPDEQEMLLSQLYFEPERLNPGDAWQIVIEPGVPLGIALVGDAVSYRVHVIRRTEQAGRARLRLARQTMDGPAEEVGAWSLDAAAREHVTREIRLPATAPGYWRLEAELHTRAEKPVARAVSALAVVPQPRYYGSWAPACYFGMQGIPNFEAAERLGAKAVRQFVFWRFSEPQPGAIRWDSHVFDQTVAETAEHHMQLMFTVVLMPPKWAAWSKHKDLPDPAKVDGYARLVREIAARYRSQPHLTTIEIENEPDLTCMKTPSLSVDEGAGYFARYLRAGAAAARQGNPKIEVASLCMSNYDFDTGLHFTQAVLDRAANAVDLFTGHTYASPREFGPGKRPKWPTQNLMPQKCAAALDAMAAHGRPRRMWVGELGWPLNADADPLGPQSLDVAACIAQSLVVGKSVPGVERYLHFTLNGCNEKGYDYGITRGDPAFPLPTALSYAAAAQVLEDAQPVDRVQVAEKLWRASFSCPQRNELIIAWWSEGEPQLLHLPPDAPLGMWKNSFFRTLSAGGQGVRVDRAPVYGVWPLKETGRTPGFLRRLAVEPAR
jgi:hypothetical protein